MLQMTFSEMLKSFPCMREYSGECNECNECNNCSTVQVTV